MVNTLCTGNRLTGEVRLGPTTTQCRLRDRPALCRELEIRIAGHKAAIKKETQFNRQVELNVKIRELEEQLQAIIAEL